MQFCFQVQILPGIRLGQLGDRDTRQATEGLQDGILRNSQLVARNLVLAILSLVDLSLAGNLLLIVLYSGYENFVSKLDLDENHVDRPPWMGSVDFSGLKMKLIASIVAISAIALLKAFMELSEGKELSDRSLMWLVVIHVTFVVSGVLLALMDWLAGKTDKH